MWSLCSFYSSADMGDSVLKRKKGDATLRAYKASPFFFYDLTKGKDDSDDHFIAEKIVKKLVIVLFIIIPSMGLYIFIAVTRDVALRRVCRTHCRKSSID